MRLTGQGAWGKEYRGSSFKLTVGRCIDVSPSEAARLMRDYPNDFIQVTEDGASYPGGAPLWPCDVSVLRKPGAPVAVGIVMTTYNGLDLTARGFLALKPADGIDLPVVVVDNCSTDGTPEWLDRNQIPYVQPLGRCGVAQALNLGLEWFQATGHAPKYLLVLNNDVALPPEYIPALVRYAEETGAEWVSGVQHEIFNPQTFKEPQDFREMISGDASALLLKREAVEAVGGWDERFAPRYGEDEDLMHRFHFAGYRTVRIPITYGGSMGGHAASNAGSIDSLEDSYRNALQIYVAKWGDAPRSANQFRHLAPDVIGRLPCNQGSGLEAPEPLKRRGRKAAIIQNGHIGDVLFAMPMAEELKRRGYSVTWYAVEPYLDIAKLCPHADEFKNAGGIAQGGHEQLFERAGRPARLHAEAEGFDVVIGAQIAPENQAEFLRSSLPFGRFMFARNGMRPRSMKPKLRAAPQAVADELAVAFGPRGEAKRLLVNFAADSLNIRIDWKYWDGLAAQLLAAGVEVWYSEPPGDAALWRGTTEVRKLGALRDKRCIPYLAQHVDMVLSTSSAPLFSAFAWGIPGICLVPRVGPGGFVANQAIQKYGLAAQGLAREWSCLDIVLSASGHPERFPESRDFARLLVEALDAGADLRGYHAEMYGALCGGGA